MVCPKEIRPGKSANSLIYAKVENDAEIKSVRCENIRK